MFNLLATIFLAAGLVMVWMDRDQWIRAVQKEWCKFMENFLK